MNYTLFVRNTNKCFLLGGRRSSLEPPATWHAGGQQLQKCVKANPARSPWCVLWSRILASSQWEAVRPSRVKHFRATPAFNLKFALRSHLSGSATTLLSIQLARFVLCGRLDTTSAAQQNILVVTPTAGAFVNARAFTIYPGVLHKRNQHKR